MPIYIFHCLTCGYEDEYFFKSIDVTGWRCKKCNGDLGEKKPAGSSFRLKNRTTGGFTKTSSDQVKGG